MSDGWSTPDGARANAVPPGSAWLPLVEVDHRISQPLLDSLEDEGVAAYAEPRPGHVPVDRLYVDASRRDLAEAIVTAELPGLLADLSPEQPEADPFDAIVAGWDAVPESPSWPESEDVAPARKPAAPVEDVPKPPRRNPEDEHFVPPPAPPLPPAQPVTRWAVLALAAGIFVLVGMPLLGTTPSAVLSVLGALAVLGGLGTLIWRMRDGFSADDGPDDGAVL